MDFGVSQAEFWICYLTKDSSSLYQEVEEKEHGNLVKLVD